MKIKKIQYLTALGLSLAMQNLWAGNIVDISVVGNTTAQAGDQRIIKIRFDRDMVKPSGFITTSPARIALDFADTGVQLNQPVLQYNDTLLSQIAVAQDGSKTRVLLNLNQPGQYNAEIKGNEVWVFVGRSNDVAATQAPVAAPAPAVQQQTAYAEETGSAPVSIDFRKGNHNEGMIDIIPPGFRGNLDIKRQPDRLVVVLKNHQLPVSAQRNLDAADFGTPVRSINLRRLGNNTEITIRNQGSWEHKVSQAGGRYTISIVPKNAAAESGLTRQNRNFTGKRISLDFQDIDVRTVLQILAKESNLNIMASDSVSGKITIFMKDVPWDQALDYVMQTRNLDYRRQGNIIRVAPKEELVRQERESLEAHKVIEELGPLYSRTFQLRYKDVNEFKRILNINENGGRNPNDSNNLLSGRGSAVIDPSTNTLIVKDNSTVIKQLEDLIAQLDVPARQVMIEARIVEAEEGLSRDLGVRFGINANRRDRHPNTTNTTTAGWNGPGGGNTFNVNLPTTAATGALTLVQNFATGALNLELNAKEEQGRTRIISSPRVMTQDRKEATIKQGVQIPYQEASSSGATSTSFKDAVLAMTVTPQITPDGKIIMDIQLNKDSIGELTLGGPTIKTNSLNTRAMVEDGGTLILGGIYTEDNGNNTSKVPVLGDIPVLGNLFRTTTRRENRKELLMFITPRIMGDMGNTLRY